MSELSGLARKRGIWSLRRRRSRLSLSVKRPLDADIVIDLIVWHGLCPWNTTPFRWRSSHCMVMPCSGEYLAGRLYGFHSPGVDRIGPHLLETRHDGLTGSKPTVQRLLIDFGELACQVNDIVLQPDNNIFFPALTQFRYIDSVLGGGHRIIKEGAIVFFPHHWIIVLFEGVRPKRRKTADKIPQGRELFTAAMSGETGPMSDESVQTKPYLLEPRVIELI